jgi:hypothetical protein
MGRVELRHYPASKLPTELRGTFAEGDFVNVTVETDADKPLSREEVLKKMLHHPVPAGKGVSIEEAVRRIRELRDEWED